MSRKLLYAGMAVMLALLATLPARTYARAEGEEPPASVPEVAASIAGNTQTGSAEPEVQSEPTATPDNAEIQIIEDVSPVEEITAAPDSAETQIIEEATPVEGIPAALEENDLMLVDESGQPIDMASQESSQTMAAADPYFKVGLVFYRFMTDCTLYPDSPTSICTDNPNPIQAAINFINTTGKIPTDGKIYVEKDIYSYDVIIDGSLENLAYLKGLIGLPEIGTNLFPTINGNVTISNLLGGFTLNGFNINGGVCFENNAGNLLLQNLYIHNETGDGLVVENHNGSVQLTNVQSRDNKGDGARINNSTSPNAPVKVTNSAFDYNDDENDTTWNTGLKITTNGAVTLEGVAASRNNGSGAEITGFSALTINNSLFDRNNPAPFSAETPTGYGLFAYTTRPAAVKISNVFTYFNANNGMEINTAGTIWMSNVRSSHSSLRTGAIDSTGETVNDRLNEDNKFTGDRWYFSGTEGQDLEISLTSQAFDTYLELRDASDDSLLESCGDIGESNNSLIICTLTKDGDYYIVVKMLSTASGVDGSYTLALNDPTNANETIRNIKGALLNAAAGTGTITITNSMFQDNAGDGLEVHSRNNIIISTTDISHNGQRGAYLDNCLFNDLTNLCVGYGKVSITSPSASGWYGGNYFLDNGATGLEVKSKGSITITNTGAYDNLGSGMDLRNDYGIAGVTINANVTNFTNVFRNNGGDGLKITSLGKLVVARSEANYNAGYGYYLTTKGLVNLKDLSASGNGASGLLVNNQMAGSIGSVILTASTGVRNTFNQNGANNQGYIPGVDIRSYGIISITNLDAHKNYAAGVYLDNRDAVLAKAITLIDSDTSENQGSGLLIYSKGTVNLKGVTSSHNSLTGSVILNSETVLDRLTTVSSFDQWWFTAPPDGYVNIILKSTEFNPYLELFDANGNLIREDDNSYGDKNAQIIIDLDAGEYFIHVSSADLNKGNYKLSINDPNQIFPPKEFRFYGVRIDNTFGISGVTITPTKSVTFNNYSDNNYHGLDINTKGSIQINNLTAVDNGGIGAYLTNQNGLGTISILNSDKTTLGAFNSNTVYGIFAASARAITLRNISADDNGSAGARIENCLAFGNECQGLGGVSILSSNGLVNSFSGNQSYGLLIFSSGNVAITDIKADANGLSGLYVRNRYDWVSGNVTLKSSGNKINTFLTNGWASLSGSFGLEVYSNGNINISKISVQTTNGTGAVLDNRQALLPKNITILDSSFDANQGFGLQAYSYGAINLQGVDSRYNSMVSGQIDLYGETIFEHLSPNYGSDRWWFSGSEDERVDIILTSDEFDVILEVFNKDNDLIAMDDDSYGGTDARLTIYLPAGGEYYIKVRQNGTGDGNYTLSLNDPDGEYLDPFKYKFDGVYLDNTLGALGVTIKSSSSNPAPSFYHNNNNGITIKSNGAVMLTNVYAMQNGADGANVQNASGTRGVTVNTSSGLLTSSFSYNTKFGLYVQSSGLVTILNSGRMYLRDNGYSGAYIDNRAVIAANIDISRVEVNNNLMKGMEIYSNGNVTLNNILAINNLTNGVYVDNCDWDKVELKCQGIGFVNIKGTLGANTFSDNGDTGLAVRSNSLITIDKVFAIQNGKNGMVLNNETGASYIRITNTVTRLNTYDGVNLTTNGAVTLKSVHSMSNGTGWDGDGLYLRTGTSALIIIYNSSFLGNEGNGIEIAYDGYGAPLLVGVSYFGNDTDMDVDGDLNLYSHLSIP